ncbi:MAG: hypothetical protein RXR20_07065 [Paraburkholderia sp.]|jgi:hypothetical protein|uniref:hypothetical protein n=1 Tax=Burkholderiaceae TaxID=119060 RepID=UPI002017090F|nr:hypothetical protein [Burkholderia sp. 4M9327F10]
MTMRLCFPNALGLLAAIGATLYTISSAAYELDAQLDCSSNAHSFIASLQSDQFIEAEPMHVEANSVNAFRPTRGSELTAFGFRVYAVLGYDQNDQLFHKGSGQAMTGSLYGVVVFGASDSVKVHLHDAGSAAAVHDVLPLVMTAVVCKSN